MTMRNIYINDNNRKYNNNKNNRKYNNDNKNITVITENIIMITTITENITMITKTDIYKQWSTSLSTNLQKFTLIWADILRKLHRLSNKYRLLFSE